MKQCADKSPFTVPENYFEEFPMRLDNMIRRKPLKAGFAGNWIAVAAALAGIVLLAQVSLFLYDRYLERNNAEYELFLLSQLGTDVYYDYFLNSDE